MKRKYWITLSNGRLCLIWFYIVLVIDIGSTDKIQYRIMLYALWITEYFFIHLLNRLCIFRINTPGPNDLNEMLNNSSSRSGCTINNRISYQIFNIMIATIYPYSIKMISAQRYFFQHFFWLLLKKKLRKKFVKMFFG